VKEHRFKIVVRERIYEVRVKPLLRILGWDLAWIKVKKVEEELR
jgi:hypothetical protein